VPALLRAKLWIPDRPVCRHGVVSSVHAGPGAPRWPRPARRWWGMHNNPDSSTPPRTTSDSNPGRPPSPLFTPRAQGPSRAAQIPAFTRGPRRMFRQAGERPDRGYRRCKEWLARPRPWLKPEQETKSLIALASASIGGVGETRWRGNWWRPDKSDERQPGMLFHADDGSLRLELIGGFGYTEWRRTEYGMTG
jgi:hypothetical protein